MLNMNDFELVKLSDKEDIKKRGRKTSVYFTINQKHIAFSRGAIDALRNVPYVDVMINKKSNQILLLESDSGIPFMRPEKKSLNSVIWNRKSIYETFKSMIPENTEPRIHVSGTPIEESGKKGILFTL